MLSEEEGDVGTLRGGDTGKPAHVGQNRGALDDDKSIFEEITGGAEFFVLGKQKVASRGYVSRFNFKGPDQQKKVGACSGGERNRIHLPKLLRSGRNLLLLDDPTHDLDLHTLLP